MTLHSAAGPPAWVRIPVLPSASSRLLYKLLGRLRLGLLVVSPFELHVISSSCILLRLKLIVGSA
jgi:hypothetical protein